MRARFRWAILILVLAGLTYKSGSAWASFGDCDSIDYLNRFGIISPANFLCEQRTVVPVGTMDGVRHIRIIHDLMGAFVEDRALAEADRAVRSAVVAIERLGSVRLDDVTVLLNEDWPPSVVRAHRRGRLLGRTQTEYPGECLITVYGVLPDSDVAGTIVHEIFHCIQNAHLLAGTGRPNGGDWWIEGSAEWFVALAIAEPDLFPKRIADFNTALDNVPPVPLDRMEYEAVAFFLWLGEVRSPRGVMEFLRQMANSPGQIAQHAAMAAALPQDQWLRFAEAYIDGHIRHPHGTDIGIRPITTWLDVRGWNGTRVENIPLEPFVLLRSVLSFSCGHWRTTGSPQTMFSVRQEDGAWSDLPNQIHNQGSSSDIYYFLVAIDATTAPVPLAIEGVLDSSCIACAGIIGNDSCLVGEWRLSSGGAVEWLRREGVSGSWAASYENIIFRSDGGFSVDPIRIEGAGALDDSGSFESQGQAQGAGRWSARDGIITLCPNTHAVAVQTEFTSRSGERAKIITRGREGSSEVAIQAPGNPIVIDTESMRETMMGLKWMEKMRKNRRMMDDNLYLGSIPDLDATGPANAVSVHLNYTCSDQNLKTELPLPGNVSPVKSIYTRVGREPRRRH